MRIRHVYYFLLMVALGLMSVAQLTQAAELAVSTATPPVGSPVTITLTNGGGSTEDYIGFFPIAAGDGGYLNWYYLNGLKSPPGVGLTTAALLFSMTYPLGDYNFRLCNSGCTVISETVSIVNAAAPAMPIPSTLFGQHITVESVWPTVPIGALAKGSYNDWSNIESSRGVRDWANLDSWVNAAEAHGVDFMFSFYGTPLWATTNSTGCTPAASGWYCPALPDDLDDLRNFVTALVTRYQGRIKFYELENEPSALGITAANLVTWSNTIIPIIRALDPQALIIGPSMANYQAGYDDQYYALGGPTTVDVLSIHGYTYTPAEPEAVDAGYVGPSQPAVWSPTLSVLHKYPALAGKPIFDTEGSWGAEGYANLTTAQKVGYLARAYLLRWANGITRFYWYEWNNDTYGTLVEANGTTPTPAGVAFGVLQQWLVGATMTTRCVAAGDGITWSCAFTRPGGYQALAVWNTTGSASYVPPSQYTQYRSLDGTLTTFTPSTSQTIGIKPLLFESNTVAAGGSCILSVTFTPSASGARTAQLNISSDATTSPDVLALSGTGGDPPVVTASLTVNGRGSVAIKQGDSVTLTYAMGDTDISCSIDQGIGALSPCTSGTVVLTPSSTPPRPLVTTTYTLTAVGNTGTAESSVTVHVSRGHGNGKGYGVIR